ncbi:hypothetical protein AVEN_84169-1 [Araneus ventricosus]|uniref:Uncharacterized protein n=1 Tax=Araneus ventricosus TaxID=182803 RepID=A0A4Y2MKP1_ARAVE|nr:hypothetical protein AVEN_84169-1 [Araneus ventricosus]
MLQPRQPLQIRRANKTIHRALSVLQLRFHRTSVRYLIVSELFLMAHLYQIPMGNCQHPSPKSLPNALEQEELNLFGHSVDRLLVRVALSNTRLDQKGSSGNY